MSRSCISMSSDGMKQALRFALVAECSESKARSGLMRLPHGDVRTPVFMPVGTQGTLKGILPDQLHNIGVEIMLGNTYHLGHRPGPWLIETAGGLHQFMNWKRPLLTDSGGFQMVSLAKLSEVTEEGVKFESPHDGSEMLLTPEKSIEIQNSIGADIIMQLDDVVSSTTSGPRVEEAMYRTIRWLDRCIAAHKRPSTQNIFPIVQGGLDSELRKRCVQELIKRDTPGFAIGGLSGGEEKSSFWQMVTLSTEYLPRSKPRYLMGVGIAVDLVVCVALGCDMFDCVYPTRTARFGSALVSWDPQCPPPGSGHAQSGGNRNLIGYLDLKHKSMALDHRPIDDECPCSTCQTFTRSYLHQIVNRETLACHLLTIHNLTYQVTLMNTIRESINRGSFPEFVRDFMSKMYPNKNYPEWVQLALASVNINLA